MIGKNFSSVGQKATFKCKEGYFIPSNKYVTNGYDIHKNRSTAVICQTVLNKLVPVSISNLALYNQILIIKYIIFKICHFISNCTPNDFDDLQRSGD